MFVTPPPIPEMLKLKLLAAAVEAAFSVNVLEVVPAGSVAGDKAAVTPAGKPVADSVTAELNPPLAVSFTELVAVDPAVIVRDGGVALNWNEGPPASFQ